MKKEISKNRILEQFNGFQVITSKDRDVNVPLFCPVCTRMLMNTTDIISYKGFECCEDCEIYWARPNSDKWKNGWRPNREDVEKNITEKRLDNINVVI